MHPRFSLRLLALFCLLFAAIVSTSGYGKESPSAKRFRTAANKTVDQFVCGTYRGNEVESMWHYRQYQNAFNLNYSSKEFNAEFRREKLKPLILKKLAV